MAPPAAPPTPEDFQDKGLDLAERGRSGLLPPDLGKALDLGSNRAYASELGLEHQRVTDAHRPVDLDVYPVERL